MNNGTSHKHNSLLALLLASSTLAFAGTALAQADGSTGGTINGPIAPMSRTGAAAATPPDQVGSAVPDAVTSTSAFTRLDSSNQGYLTIEQVQSMSGFSESFEAADTNHDGKLSLDEFSKAWDQYSNKRH